MDARATLRGSRSSTRASATLMLVVALLAAVVVGWIGGYVVRGLALPAPTTNSVTTPRPFVVEPVPYSTPAIATSPGPTRDPDGFAVPI